MSSMVAAQPFFFLSARVAVTVSVATRAPVPCQSATINSMNKVVQQNREEAQSNTGPSSTVKKLLMLLFFPTEQLVCFYANTINLDGASCEFDMNFRICTSLCKITEQGQY